MRIPSGTTDQYLYFVAVDSTDFTTRETGLSSFTVYRSRNGGAAAAMTTPTINETDSSNMPGVYELLLDEDMTIDSGDDSQEMVFHITHAGMAPVTRTLELYRAKITVGETLTVSSGVSSANTIQISGDATAADNLESYCDGTTPQPVNATQISGDATAADNLEAQYDGTGLTGDNYPATQAQVGDIAVGSAGISTTAASFTKAGAEPETNTYTSTAALDGTYHIVEDDSTSTDVYYQFSIGPNGIPVQVEWTGYAQSNGDSYAVYFYNWAGTSWDQVGTLTAANGTTPVSDTFSATTAHVGTGANDGLVRFRFASSDGTAIATDRILCTYSVINAAIGYDLAAVWVDEVGGDSTGTTPGVDGLVTNRSDDFDNAQDIADALGYHDIRVTNGNSITLSDALEGYDIYGNQVTLALGTQNIGDSEFFDFKSITGTGTSTGGRVIFNRCDLGTATLPGDSSFVNCGFEGTLTFSDAGDVHVVHSYSEVAGSGAPVFDCNSPASAFTMSYRGWSGGITISGINSNCTISLDIISGGTVTLNGADGNVQVRGMCKVVDNRTGSPTLGTSQVINADTINAEVDTALADYDAVVPADLPTNFSSLVISGAGAVDSLVQGFLNNTIAETTADNIAGNFEIFFDNADATTTQTVDDVGGGGGGGGDATEAKQDIIIAALGVVDGIVDAILVDTGTTIPATLTTIDGIVDDILVDTGTTLPTAIAAISTGAGSGAYTITVTVTDGTDPLQNATVRILDGSTTMATGTTDASGNVEFSLDAATYTVAITKVNYQFTPTTRTVTGDETGTLVNDLEMTALAISAVTTGIRTVSFDNVLNSMARRQGLDPTNFFQENVAATYAEYLNAAYEYIWRWYQWPEAITIEQVTFASQKIAFSGVTAYPIADVFMVSQAHPVTSTNPQPVDFKVTGGYLYVPSTVGDSDLYVTYRRPVPQFTTTDYSASATYAVDDLIRFTDGDCYKCIDATSAGQSPTTTAAKWQKQEIIDYLKNSLIHGALIEALAEEGQHSTSLYEDQKLQGYLEDLLDRLELDQKQFRFLTSGADRR